MTDLGDALLTSKPNQPDKDVLALVSDLTPCGENVVIY